MSCLCRGYLRLEDSQWRITTHSASSYAVATTLLAIVLWGVYAYYIQFMTGLGVTGMRAVVSWAFYIINFVFFIGISHVGALMSALLRLTNAEWRKLITRIAEVVTFAPTARSSGRGLRMNIRHRFKSHRRP